MQRLEQLNKQTATELQKFNKCNSELVTWSKNGLSPEYRKMNT